MRKTYVILLSILVCCSMKAADLTFSDNEIVCGFGDSWQFAGVNNSVVTGYRMLEYVQSYTALNYPQYTIPFYNFGRSGGTMADMLTNRVQKLGLPVWGYQSNSFQHLGIACMTDNGGLDSNSITLVASNIFLAPKVMSDGTSTLNTQTGWASTATVQWIGLGEPPLEGSGPDTAQRDRNNAITNVGWTLGARGVDSWNMLSPSWFSDYTANGGTNVQWSGSVGGHFTSGGALSWAMAFLKGITTDTNISTATVDWNSTTPVLTNHCVISGISKSGGALTCHRLDDRLPMAWDWADGTITNDATTAFNLIPTDADYFRFTIQVTNIPAGTYTVKIDGVTCATLTGTQLAEGWNMFTNTVGPYADQRKEVLRQIRHEKYVNSTTLVQGSAGDQEGEISLASNADTQWSTPNSKRGDDLIAAMNTKVGQLQTNFASIKLAAQPVSRTFVISPVSSTTITTLNATTLNVGP